MKGKKEEKITNQILANTILKKVEQILFPEGQCQCIIWVFKCLTSSSFLFFWLEFEKHMAWGNSLKFTASIDCLVKVSAPCSVGFSIGLHKTWQLGAFRRSDPRETNTSRKLKCLLCCLQFSAIIKWTAINIFATKYIFDIHVVSIMYIFRGRIALTLPSWLKCHHLWKAFPDLSKIDLSPVSVCPIIPFYFVQDQHCLKLS